MTNPDDRKGIKKDVAELQTYLRVTFKALGWTRPVESEPDVGYVYIGNSEPFGSYSFDIHVTTRIKDTPLVGPHPVRTYKFTQYDEIGGDGDPVTSDLTAWPCDTLDGILEKTVSALAMQIVGPAVAHLSEDLPF